MKIPFKKLHPDAKIPTYGHTPDAGMDLFAMEDVTLEPGEQKVIPTGVAICIPEGYAGLIWDKGSLSHKHGIKAMGGVFDAGYTGEIFLCSINLSDKQYTFEKGHKVAQMIVQPIVHADLFEVEEFEDTARGTKGFGSTGK